MKIPKKITMDNMFTEQLTEHSKPFFCPDQSKLFEQCFNLNRFIVCFLLPRLVYYRDNCDSQLTYYDEEGREIGIIQPKNSDKENAKIQEKSCQVFENMLKGFWLFANGDPDYFSRDEERMIQEAFHILGYNIKALWM